MVRLDTSIRKKNPLGNLLLEFLGGVGAFVHKFLLHILTEIEIIILENAMLIWRFKNEL